MSAIVEKLPLKKKFICCFKLKVGGYVAASIGIIHPAIFVALYFREKMHDWVTNIGGVMAAFLFVASILLFVGIYTRRHLLVMVWVYFSLVFIVTMVVIIIMLGVRYITSGRFWISGQVCAQLFLYLFFFYLIVIVNSFAVDIEEIDEE